MPSKWERYAAWGGVAFVVLGLLGAFLPGSPPQPNASAAKVAKFLSDHAGALKAGQVIFLFGIVAGVWWFGSLFRRLADAEGAQPRLALLAAIGFTWAIVFIAVGGGVLTAMALRRNEIGAGVLPLFAISNILISTSAIGVLVLVSAVGALVVRANVFPAWVAWLSWLVGIVEIVAAFSTASLASFPFVFGFIGFILWFAWTLVISWFLAKPAQS